MIFLELYIIAFIVFLAIDAVWLGLVAPKFYKSQIGHLMAEKPNFIAALVFYLIFIGGLVYFVLMPALDEESFSKVVVGGMLFGFITYATYDLTNLATLKNWPLLVTGIDLLWGTVLSLSVSVVTYGVYLWIF
ncbi:MAG: DUF2177 family protein [Candidatus Izemoplasmataceae bacterium]